MKKKFPRVLRDSEKESTPKPALGMGASEAPRLRNGRGLRLVDFKLSAPGGWEERQDKDLGELVIVLSL